MAELVHDADIVVIQEVQVDEDGLQAIEKLTTELALKGSRWGYTISEPTHSKGSERYAFLWKVNSVKLKNDAWLENSLDELLDREPFMARFEHDGKTLLLVDFHAFPKKKEPWLEAKELYRINNKYHADNLIIMGDFNLSQEDQAFDRLKHDGIVPALKGIRTTIKMEPNEEGERFAHEYDNLFYEKSSFKILKSGRIDFTKRFETLKDARKVSDHVPVFVELK
jgi:deoxyribonuclease-1-like protein